MGKKIIKTFRAAAACFMLAALLFSVCGLPVSFAESIDGSAKVSITLDFKNEKIHFTADAYKIAEYNDGVFKYVDALNELNLKPYAKLTRSDERREAMNQIDGFVDRNNFAPDATVTSEQGKVVFAGLDCGVYLIRRNESADSNAVLKTPYMVEAPELNTKTNTYEYDVLVKPAFENTTWFTFSTEVVRGCVIIALMVLCVLMCLYGYRILSVVLFLVVGIIFGLFGTLVGKKVSPSLVYQMVFFVTFAATGSGFVVMLLNLFRPIFTLPFIQKLFGSLAIVLTAMIGGVGFFWLAANNTFLSPLVAAIISAAIAVIGIVCQYLHKRRDTPHYTYDDLIKMEITEEEALHQ